MVSWCHHPEIWLPHGSPPLPDHIGDHVYQGADLGSASVSRTGLGSEVSSATAGSGKGETPAMNMTPVPASGGASLYHLPYG